MFEHLILICDLNELSIILSLLVGDKSQVRVALLAVLTDSKRIIQGILLEEFLRVVVAVDVDLRKSIIDCRILRAGIESILEERKKQLETIATLNFSHQLINWNLSLNRHQEVLDNRFFTVHIEETTDDRRCS